MKKQKTPQGLVFVDMAFVWQFARKQTPCAIVCALLLIVLGATMNIAAWIALPAAVHFAETAVSPKAALPMIGGITAVIFVTRFLWKYIDGVFFVQCDHLRMRACTRVAACSQSVDAATREEALRVCGTHINAPLPRSLQALSLLGAHLLGAAFCAIALGGDHGWLLFVSAVATVLRAAAHFAVTAWDRRRSGEEHTLDKQLARVPEAVLSGRIAADITVFSLRPWLIAVHDSAANAMDAFLKRRCRAYIVFTVADALLTLLCSGAVYGLLVFKALHDGMELSAFLLAFATVGGFSQSVAFAIDDAQTLVADVIAVWCVRVALEGGRKA